MSDQRLLDRITVVVGGGRGLGEATSHRYAKEGAVVVVADLNKEFADSVAQNIKSSGGRASAAVVDVTKRANVENLVSSVVKDHGRIDVIVIYAGIALFGPAMDVTDETWHRQLDINITGTFLCSQIAGRQIIKQKSGRIITISSVMGQRSGDRRMAYGTTKGAVIALTKHMAAELAEHNVTINSIAPGPVKTEFWLAANPDAEAAESAYLTNIPMGRLGQPEDIANAAFMLASDDAAYITGHVLNVDGGFIATGVRDGIY